MHNQSLVTKQNSSRSLLGKNRVYSPQINEVSVFVLRRIAWGVGKPMTITLDQVIAGLLPNINIATDCPACKDNLRCGLCPFNTQLPEFPDIERLLNK